MKQIQKKFYRDMIIMLTSSILIWLVSIIAYDSIKGRELTDCIKYYDNWRGLTTENLRYEVLDDGIIEVEDIWIEEDMIYYRVKGIGAGKTMMVLHTSEDEIFFLGEEFRVSSFGTVTEGTSGNFSNCRFHLFMNSLLLTAIALILLINLIRYSKQLKYSYEMMFVGGLLIWLVCTLISQWYAWINFQGVYSYYSTLKQSAFLYILYTAPIIIVFCIALTISNISLIRHERFRFTNILGIIISAVLFVGSIIALAINNIGFSGSETKMHIINIAIDIYTVGYSVFAALLEGAIIGGIMAAKNVPSFDCDYIIILGCMIRKDGSLTPLLRGRVDRAIAHASRQEERSGKSPVFVPSGGQGSNEVMAEADAMKNYLLSQGIPEERIIVENKSKNTAENMRFSRELIMEQKEDAKIAFSTTNYHVFRSGIIATQNGFIPEGMGSKTKWYFWPNAFMREYVGMLTYTKLEIVIIFALLIASFTVLEVFM